MANINIADTWVPLGSAQVATVTAGAALQSGDPFFIDPADGRAKPAQCDGTADEANCQGIILAGGAAGQLVTVMYLGDAQSTAQFVAGTPYFLSQTTGNICLHGDLVATNRVTQIGIAISTTVLRVRPLATGVVL